MFWKIEVQTDDVVERLLKALVLGKLEILNLGMHLIPLTPAVVVWDFLQGLPPTKSLPVTGGKASACPKRR